MASIVPYGKDNTTGVPGFVKSGDSIVGEDGVPIGGGGVGSPQLEPFTPTPGQTIFAVASDVVASLPVIFIANGIMYPRVSSYVTIGGAGNRTITWGGAFALETGDRVEILYWTP